MISFGPASIAGTSYFAIIFALGFLLGSVRTVTLGIWRDVDLIVAVMLELPIILAASWVCCGWIITRCSVPARHAHRLWMGLVAFGLLMAAETALALLLMGRSPTEHVASYREPAHVLGLAGQLAFAAFPLLRR